VSDKKQVYVLDIDSLEEATQNVVFQLNNVRGWIDVRQFECALIKAECLVSDLKRAIAIQQEKKS